MPYIPNPTWADGPGGGTAISAAKLNVIEAGIGAAIPKDLVDAKGDLLAATAADTVARLAVGSNGQMLIADSTQATGVRWGTPPGFNLPYLATFTGQSVSSTGTANTAYYMPIVAAASLAVTSIKFFVGTQSGNYDIGVYDSTFAKVWARGSTAVPATGPATVLISAGTPTSLTVTTGVYYLAFAADNGTAAVHITNGAAISTGGIGYSKASSFPLPSSLSSGTTPPPDGHGVWVAIV